MRNSIPQLTHKKNGRNTANSRTGIQTQAPAQNPHRNHNDGRQLVRNHRSDNQLRADARLATQQIFLADMVDWRRTFRPSTLHDQKQNLWRSRSSCGGVCAGEVFVRG